MQSFRGDHVGHEESPAKQQPAILDAPKLALQCLG